MAEGSRYRRNPAVSETQVDAEIFLVDPDTQEVFYLDEAGASLWRLIETPQSFAEILAVYGAAFPGVANETLEGDLRAALDALLERDLVVTI